MSPTLAPDGSRVAVAVRDKGQSGIWVKAVSGGTPTRLTVEHRNASEPAWSPDGQWVSYLAGTASANRGDVWHQRSDGTGRSERVAESERPLSEQIWAPVSGTLLMRTTTSTPGVGDIVMLRPGSRSRGGSAAGDAAHRILTGWSIGSTKSERRARPRPHEPRTPHRRPFNQETMMASDPKPRVGDPAPLLELPTESGDRFALGDLAGKPILLSFLSHAA